MKKIFFTTALLLVCGIAGLRAQHYLGVRGGFGNGTVRLAPPEDTKSLWGLYNGGISWKYYSREKYLGGVEADLMYIQKGYKFPQPGTPDTIYTRWVNSVELPLFWQPHVYVLHRRMRVYLNLGVVFSYNIDAFEENRSHRDPGNLNPPFYARRPYEMTLVRDNKWGYGLCGGMGINYITGRFEWMIEGRYDLGYSDIFKNKTIYPPNVYQRSPLDNLYFNVGVYYRISKSDILSAPSERTAQMISQREAKRIARKAGARARKASGKAEEDAGSPRPEEASPDGQPPAPPEEEQPATPQQEKQPVAPEQEKEQPAAPAKQQEQTPGSPSAPARTPAGPAPAGDKPTQPDTK